MTNTRLIYKVKPIGLNGQDHLIALVRYLAHPLKLEILPEMASKKSSDLGDLPQPI